MNSEIFNLEFEALRASGAEANRIEYYRRQLDVLKFSLMRQINLSDNPFARSRQVFEWLWRQKPQRYKRNGPYKLHDVINNQINKDTPVVGNCLGLTVLYNCLLMRLDINAEALYLENAFDVGPHVLSLLVINNDKVDIENVFPNGFDYRDHLHNTSRRRWGDKELVADIYLRSGNECFEKEKPDEALENYDKSIILNPEYETAHLNRTILLEKMSENHIKRSSHEKNKD